VRIKLEGIVTATVTLVLGAAMLVYVGNTTLYLAPPNPVTAQLLPVIRAIQNPLFAQNWHLFAPDPVKSDFVLTVRCRTKDEFSAWQDITAPLLARHQSARTSPMARVLRVQQNAVRVWMGRTGDEDWRRAVCRVQPGNPLCRGEDPIARRMQETGLYVLARVASAACDHLIGRGRASRVQLALLIHTPPPFSRRAQPLEAGSTRYVILPWLPYQQVGG